MSSKYRSSSTDGKQIDQYERPFYKRRPCCATCLIITLLIVLGIIVTVAVMHDWIWSLLAVGSGHTCKTVCSGIFLANRTYDSLKAEELTIVPPICSNKIDYDKEEVVCDCLLFLQKKTAKYMGEDFGCTLYYEDDFTQPVYVPDENSRKLAEDTFPEDDWEDATQGSGNEFDNVDYDRINSILTSKFVMPTEEIVKEEHPDWSDDQVEDYIKDEEKRLDKEGSFACAVIYKGKLIGEGYAEWLNIYRDTRVLGWSMTKSVTATVIGVRAHEGKFDLEAFPQAPEWSDEEKEERNITQMHLMHMSSGLEWDESYDLVTDVTRMLYEHSDSASFAADVPQIHRPDEEWYYSSGTTNILARELRYTFEDDGGDEAYWSYPKNRLFNVIGAKTFMIEPDSSGTFIGSSYAWATARDWARLGWLHVHDGVWEGERILPEGWSDFVNTTAPAAANYYGAQWWLNPWRTEDESELDRYPDEKKSQEWLKGLPKSAFFASGHDGQTLLVVPSKQMVVARFGYTPSSVDWGKADFFKGIVDSVDQEEWA